MGVSGTSRVLVYIAMFILASAVLVSAIPTKDPIDPSGSLNDLGFTAYNIFSVGSPTGDTCVDTQENPYIPVDTTCGVGACASTGITSCVNGVVQDSCTPGEPTGADDNCNGIDENCDGIADNHYVPDTSCFKPGVCASGDVPSSCTDGKETLCATGSPTGLDDNCNGIDEDCDGVADENYVSLDTSCGVGACSATGHTSCVDGNVQDSCTPGQPTDEICDGLDNNCNGQIDEGVTQACGEGACAGIETCVGAYQWSACSTRTLHVGICSVCDENGNVAYGANRNADCSSYTLPEINTCNDPSDNKSFTLDYAAAFDSVCTGIGTCSQEDSQTITHTCAKSCGAECESNEDCANKCEGSVYSSGGSCDTTDTCSCSYTTTEDCSTHTGWYNTTTTQWINTSSCTEKEQVQQEYRDYSCSAESGCTYEVTDHKWIDTGNVRNKEDGTTCDDGLFCTVNDQCTAGVCGGAPRDCSANNLPAIAKCNNNPDNMPSTWDSAAGFTSVCDEANKQCTTGSYEFTHTCNTETCGAECESNADCVNKCVEDVYYSGGTCDTGSTCACSYTPENCNTHDGWYNTTTTQWIATGQCTEKEQLQQEYRDYSCSESGCTYAVTGYKWIDTGNVRNKEDGTTCDDGLFCTVNDQCTAGVCAGTQMDCSANDLPAVSRCDNNPDNNPLTYDSRAAFTSECVDGTCSQGSQTITHTCDKETCSAECTLGEIQTQPCGVSDVGECKLGTQTRICTDGCTWGDWGACVGEIDPSPEICDGKDNNCNGEIDENLTRPTTCGVGACAGNTGIETCTAGTWGGDTCDPLAGASPEVCEGSVDENCNGLVDEGCECTIGATRACGSDVGECVKGIQTCQSDGKWGTECVGAIGPSPEICDGLDNNCNGQIDENLTQACGEGICSGIMTCSMGTWGECSTSGSDAGVCAKCDENGTIVYDSTQNADCSGTDLPAINTCTYNPDDNQLTLDQASGFVSECTGIGTCSQGSQTLTHTCNTETCGAECESNADCANKCVGNVYNSGGICDTASTCSCSYTTEDCSAHNGWYSTTTTQWIATAGQCTEKEQLQQEYRDYSCSAESGCTYEVTDHKWIDTGNVRNKEDGTTCDDGLFCTVNDQCTAGVCGGAPRDCSANNLPEIATCNNNPDNKPFTFDSAAGFTSVCDEENDKCTTGSYDYTFTCDKARCGAGCESDADCSNKCVGEVYYSGGSCDTANTCSCSYTTEDCNTNDGWYNTSLVWVKADDCSDKELVNREYRDYSCSLYGCTYSVTARDSPETGRKRSHDDGLACTLSPGIIGRCLVGVCAAAPRTSWSINYPVMRSNLISLQGKDMSTINSLSGNLNAYLETSRGIQTQGGLYLQIAYGSGPMDVYSISWDTLVDVTNLVIDSNTLSIIQVSGKLIKNRQVQSYYPLTLTYHKDTQLVDIQTPDFTLKNLESHQRCVNLFWRKICYYVP